MESRNLQNTLCFLKMRTKEIRRDSFEGSYRESEYSQVIQGQENVSLL